jgi:hypothetical protein
MRDMIEKALQLGFAQCLCLFTLTDEFSPHLLILQSGGRFYYEVIKLSSVPSAKTLRFSDLVMKFYFHYEQGHELGAFHCISGTRLPSVPW